MKPNTNDTDTMITTNIKTSGSDIVADRLTNLRLKEYGKRHSLTPDAVRVVTYLYLNGPSGAIAVLAGTNLRHDMFFNALCNANGILIMDKRALTIDVCLTSRRAIAAIPDSVFKKPEENRVAMLGTPESSAPTEVKMDPEPVATVHHEPEHGMDDGSTLATATNE